MPEESCPPLTAAQKREIMDCVNNDRPLPPRYRYLLFDDNGPELIWHGKQACVCPPVPRLQIFDQIGATSQAEAPDACACWVNKLILGDNLEIMAALAADPLREEIARQGGLKLIYIDPPFGVGSDFRMAIDVGGAALSGVAYRDRWGSGPHSFVAMIHARLTLMAQLLAADGCIYAHCDWRSNAIMRLLLDEIFAYHVNEIVWHYTGGGRSGRHFSRKHDSLLVYCKSDHFLFNKDAIRIPYKESSGFARGGIVSKKGKRYLPHPAGTIPDDVWDIPIINPLAKERLGYPTQKPEKLLERVLLASSNPGDLVADFFCGSGTLPAVAEKLGRKWIATDIGSLAIHTTRKRMISVQAELAAQNRPARPFALLKAQAEAPAAKTAAAQPAGKHAQISMELKPCAGGIIVKLTDSGGKTTPALLEDQLPVGVKLVRKTEGGKMEDETSGEHQEPAWAGWIDYWAVAFAKTGAKPGTTIFRNVWQTFRPRHDGRLILQSPCLAPPADAREILIKVVDVLGEETVVHSSLDNILDKPGVS